MYPFLQITESIRLPTGGVLMAIAFFLGAFITFLRAKRFPMGTQRFPVVALAILVGSSTGAVVLASWVEEPTVERFGASSFYGGLIGSVLALWLCSIHQKFSFLHWGDLIAPGVALGVCVGRLACFVSGCCWGLPSALPLSVEFPHSHQNPWPPPVPIHPVQLYEASLALGLFVYLIRIPVDDLPVGAVFHRFLCGYALIRFFTEFFRGDAYRGFIFGGAMSFSQGVSLLLLVLCVATGFFSRFRTRRLVGSLEE